MLGNSVIKNYKMRLSDTDAKQWENCKAELDKFCKQSKRTALIADEKGFNKVREKCFIEGEIIGLVTAAATIGVISLVNHVHERRKRAKELRDEIREFNEFMDEKFNKKLKES